MSGGAAKVARTLADAIAATSALEWRQGVVTAITGTGLTCSVLVGGATTPLTNVRYFAACGPVVGQTVWLLRDGPDWLVVGPVAGVGSRGPGCLVRRTTLQTITTATDTAVTWQAADLNVGPMWNAGLNPTRLTAPLPGRWAGKATIRFATSASTAERYATVRVNGVALSRLGEQGLNPSGGIVTLGFAWAGILALNDYIEVVTFHATGANLDIISTFTWSISLSAEWLGPA